jgi:hypothetical protein
MRRESTCCWGMYTPPFGHGAIAMQYAKSSFDSVASRRSHSRTRFAVRFKAVSRTIERSELFYDRVMGILGFRKNAFVIGDESRRARTRFLLTWIASLVLTSSVG